MKKMSGILVYNASLTSAKFTQLHEVYVQSAASLGIALSLCSNVELMQIIEQGKCNIALPPVDFVLFLDKDLLLAKLLEAQGLRLFNRARVIELCDDKRLTYATLANQGLPLIDTVFAPLLFGSCDLSAFNSALVARFGFPLVLKAAFGSFGQQVHLVENETMLKELQAHYQTIPHLYQRFIASSMGVDVRIQMVKEEVVVAVKRTNASDFRANVTNGGTMEAYDPPAAFCEVAKRIARILDSDFIGVDLLLDEAGQPLVCEVNSNAHIVNILHTTHINVAAAIFKHIERELKDA